MLAIDITTVPRKKYAQALAAVRRGAEWNIDTRTWEAEEISGALCNLRGWGATITEATEPADRGDFDRDYCH